MVIYEKFNLGDYYDILDQNYCLYTRGMFVGFIFNEDYKVDEDSYLVFQINKYKSEYYCLGKPCLVETDLDLLGDISYDQIFIRKDFFARKTIEALMKSLKSNYFFAPKIDDFGYFVELGFRVDSIKKTND